MSKRALIIVDMINAFAGRKGSLYVKGAEKLLPGILQLMRDFDIVAFACDHHEENDPEFKQFPPHAIRGTWDSLLVSKLCDEPAAPHTGIFWKQAFNAFTNGYLKDFLKRNKVKIVYICGVATEYCIQATALGAKREGFTTAVVVDAVQAIDQARGALALIDMGQVGVVGTTVKLLTESQDAQSME